MIRIYKLQHTDHHDQTDLNELIYSLIKMPDTIRLQALKTEWSANISKALEEYAQIHYNIAFI